MNFKHVLIVTYGRSGSTLLQGLLNSIDGCIVRGENFNACYGLYKAFTSFSESKKQLFRGSSTDLPTNPWYGASLYDEQRFLFDAKSLLMNQLIPFSADENIECVGFKEIRYMQYGTEGGVKGIELKEYLDFLMMLLPDCAIVLLTRKHEDVMRSAWWGKKEKKVLKEQLLHFENVMTRYAYNNPSVFNLDYSDMTERSTRLASLFEFLGAEYVDAMIEKVLTTKHSYKTNDFVKTTGLQFDIADLDILQHASVNMYVKYVEKKKLYSIRGKVLLKASAPKGFELVVDGNSGLRVVKWGGVTPQLAKKFPRNPYSNNAGFRIDNIKIPKNKIIEIMLMDESGATQCLAKLVVDA